MGITGSLDIHLLKPHLFQKQLFKNIHNTSTNSIRVSKRFFLDFQTQTLKCMIGLKYQNVLIFPSSRYPFPFHFFHKFLSLSFLSSFQFYFFLSHCICFIFPVQWLSIAILSFSLLPISSHSFPSLPFPSLTYDEFVQRFSSLELVVSCGLYALKLKKHEINQNIKI